MKRVLNKRLADETADAVRRSEAEAIGELQGLPAAGMKVIAGVELPDSTDVPVNHKLGKAPTWLRESAVRGAATAGVVVDLGSRNTAGGSVDRSQTVVLRATGYGATITVDVLVVP